MVRRAWWATVHGDSGIGHDLVTDPPPRGKEREPYFLNQGFDKPKHRHLGETPQCLGAAWCSDPLRWHAYLLPEASYSSSFGSAPSSHEVWILCCASFLCVHEALWFYFAELLSVGILDHDAFWNTVSISPTSLNIIYIITLYHPGLE